MTGWLDDRRPVRRVQRRPETAYDPRQWPYRLAPVAQLLESGLDRASESRLHEALQLVRSAGAPRWAYFLRAETMHGLYTYLERLEGGPPTRLHELSHGESFLEVLGQHFAAPGLYLLDEPEAALSFTSCLTLVGLLDQLATDGSQVLCATHSPLLTALPGATILQLDDAGYAAVSWPELDLVDHWRRYLGDPQAYLRHILG